MASLRTRAFGVAEMLVVIGIVAMLIGLVIPSIRRVRSEAQSTVCKSRLQQIGQALAMYAVENRGHLLPRERPQVVLTDWSKLAFKKAYVPESVLCPTRLGHERISYPLNTWLVIHAVRHGHRFRDASSSQIVLAGESPAGSNYSSYVPMIGPDSGWTYDPFRHGKRGSNYLWFDLHVSQATLIRSREAQDDWDFNH